MMCNKCCAIVGLVFLILGILFLLVDLGLWDFWGISWWTALFVLGGLFHICASRCPECCSARKKK